MSKLNRDREYGILMRKLHEARRKCSNHPEKVTGIYLEIAEYLRNGLSNIDEAKLNYNKVVNYGKDFDVCSLDCSLACRNLAEMAIEDDDFDNAINNISKSLEYAYRSKDHGVIQQALHQRAHICLSCGLPDKALDYVEECKNYLLENSTEIDSLKKDGDSNCRLAHLQNLTAAIFMAMDGYNSKGLEVNEKAMKYAREKNDWPLYYRCLLTKLNLTVGSERIQIAESMLNVAGKIVPKNSDERRFRHESRCHLALELLRHCDQGNVTLAKKSLWKCYDENEKQPENVSPDLQEELKKALVFVYKVEQRENMAKSMNVKESAKRRSAQMLVFEKIGDDATNLGMNEIALHYYQKMLKCADSTEDQKKAWCSMAETAKDCHLFERAVEFYRQARRKEEQLGCTDEQLLETDMAIAILSADVESLTLNERLQLFRDVYSKCMYAKQKWNILPEYMKFLKAHPNICSKEEFERIQRENLNNKEEMIGDDDSETDNDMNESTAKDEYDFMDDAQILFALKNEMKELTHQEKIIRQRSDKNKHGESNLHEVARSDDYQRLKELIERKYNVNQLDHGGWTPLSEAVSAQQIANVRLLLMSGANPNTRSTEFLVDDSENKITSSGLTPLMEACSLGNLDIAKILIQFKARISTKDDDDWTAFEYLNEFITNAKRLETAEKEKMNKFAEILKRKQIEEGFEPRTYNEFLELLELKKVASKKGRRNSSTNSKQAKPKRNHQIDCFDDINQSSSSNKAWIDDQSDESENDENYKNYGEDDDVDEVESDEETRNLEDYRKCINGLRKRRSSEDPEFSRTTPLMVNRKRSSANFMKAAGPSAKKYFK